MDSGTLQGLITIVFFVSFLALVWMAYKPSSKALYEERGRIPLDDPIEKQMSQASNKQLDKE